MSSNQAGESASIILCSSKQTRFHIESPVWQELDIEGLHITIASADSSGKPKGKARSEGLEILTNATLKLKPGIHYALVGRNGTGKSTLLKAIAEKLIPGIPLGTRIAILQQASDGEMKSEGSVTPSEESSSKSQKPRSVVEEVIEKSLARDIIQGEIDILLPAVEGTGDAFASVRAIRTVRHERLKRELFELDKDARLRSGARGWDARKALIAFEKRIKDYEAVMLQDPAELSATELSEETEAAVTLLTELQSQLEPTRLAETEVRARKILVGIGYPKGDLDKPVTSLSGGRRMQCSLAIALLAETDILILDEPTNFLDLLGILWLQRHLIDLQETAQTTVLLVSHDRDFIDKACQETIILRDQTLTYFRGNFSTYEEEQRLKKINLTKMNDALDRQRSHQEKTVAQNIKIGKATGDDNKLKLAKSRQKKLDDKMGLKVSAKGGRWKLNRDMGGYHLNAKAEIDIPQDEKGVNILLPMAPDLRFPGPLISLEGVTFRYPRTPAAAKSVLDNVNLTIHMGDRIGILGLNGAGKSTLIQLVTETTKPTKGSVTKHPRLRLGYYSQHAVEELQVLGRTESELTALSLLTREVEGELDEGELRGLLGSLGLPGRIASDVPLAKLSGGQLVRLGLARLLWQCPQLLVLDEITTHLDFYTVTALSNALSEWNGAILLVSHDRYMIRRVVEGEVVGNGEDDDEEEEGEVERRRKVFLLKGGKLVESEVDKFEESLEKRLAKLALS